MLPGLKPGSRILLIEPPFYKLFGYTRWNYPATLTIVGSYLKELGYDVSILDADKPLSNFKPLTRSETRENYDLYKSAVTDDENPVWDEILNVIRDFKPHGVGFTSISAQIASANMIAKKIKQHHGNTIKIFLGGSHVNGMLQHLPSYDFGSDYDFIVPKVSSSLKKMFDRKPERKLIIDYDSYLPKDAASILTCTGCPGRCKFCCNSLDHSMILREVNNIRDELEEINDIYKNIPYLDVMDDCLFFNKSHFSKVCQIAKEMGNPIHCSARMMSLTPRKLDEFVSSGGERLYVGVESGSQVVLDRIGKKQRISEVIKRAKWINASNIQWTASFIVAFPFETLDDLKRTEELIYSITPSFVSINSFVPYPGTEFFQQYYLNRSISFVDLFQQNKTNIVQVTGEVEKYLEYLYALFDDYNKVHDPALKV